MLFINPLYNHLYSLPAPGTAYLAGYLEKQNYQGIEILDLQHRKNCKKEILNRIFSHKYIGISVNIGTIDSAIKTAKIIRNHNKENIIIMGGPYASMIPDKLIPEYADIVVHGEGEHILRDILAEVTINEINGISFLNGSRIVTTAPRPNITDLDALPFPAWHLLDLKQYNFPSGKRPMLPIITSRGCPYKCINCTHIVHGYNFRQRSPENIVDECEYLIKRFSIREIQIWDDNFTFSPDRVIETCNLILKKNIKVHFSCPSGIRADIGTPEMFKIMKRAGFYFVSLGVESGNQEIVNKLGKNLDLEKVKYTVGLLNDVGIRINLHFMLYLPWDTEKTIEKTINFAKSLKVHLAHFHMTTPFPGTELYNIIKKDGNLFNKSDFMFSTYQSSKPSFEVYGLTRKNAKKMIAKAYLQFYLRPSQIIRFLTKKFNYYRNPIAFFSYMVRRFFAKHITFSEKTNQALNCHES